MAKPVVVTFERKRYTWDGQRWYGTEDYVAPPPSLIIKLNALIPRKPPKDKPAGAHPA